MAKPSYKEELLEQLGKLGPTEQKKLLQFACSLSKSSEAGIPGKNLLGFAGLIAMDDLHEISGIIEEDCEKVNPDEW